jgi:hypothetical protein
MRTAISENNHRWASPFGLLETSPTKPSMCIDNRSGSVIGWWKGSTTGKVNTVSCDVEK